MRDQIALLNSRMDALAEAIRTLEQLYDLLVEMLPQKGRRRTNGQESTARD
jgi:hypothetical protein